MGPLSHIPQAQRSGYDGAGRVDSQAIAPYRGARPPCSPSLGEGVLAAQLWHLKSCGITKSRSNSICSREASRTAGGAGNRKASAP